MTKTEDAGCSQAGTDVIFFWICIGKTTTNKEAFHRTGVMHPYFGKGHGGSVYVDDTHKQAELWQVM